MKIPPKLLKKLKGTELYDPVKDTVSDFTEWFKFSGTLFFREYTDHGNDHITEVCRSMTKLITPASWEHVTSEDCAAIVLSALLHDCAMHLTEDGFLELLENKNTVSPLTGAPAPDWHELWFDYKRECKRWDPHKWEEVTGLKDPVSELPDNSVRWTSQHHRWIGEFVRRHHADIAYYIARYGLPGPDNERLQLERINKNLADIIGFIARSHNYPMRDSVDLLKKSRKKKQLTKSKVHIPYIMGLLRVADYLEIKPNRAPKVVSFRCRTLRSPLSEQEWLNHQAVHGIKIHIRDREALAVEAKPEDVTTYLRLKTLLGNIQKELDETWATWGEVYSRDEKLRNLGMLYRRIRSNIDDAEKFGKTVSYIPTHAKFRASDGELLKLLVEPLYDGRPEYGVRELIQNAVDACLERDNYKKHHLNSQFDLAKLSARADVIVTLEEKSDGTGWFIIKDTGIGMTEDVIQRYFLTAGASYRSSEEWKELHHSKVLRTGRFGVGLLSAFLLGKKIQVKTRHISKPADQGITFECELEGSEIELRRHTCQVGTEIRILLDKETFTALLPSTNVESDLEYKWDWYTGEYPKLAAFIKFHPKSEHCEDYPLNNSHKLALRQKYQFPYDKTDLPWEWRRLNNEDYSDVHWTWHQPFFACNNILITDSVLTLDPKKQRRATKYVWQKPYLSSYPYSLFCPSISIFDRNGKLPLNLQRSTLTDSDLTFLKPSLLTAVCRDIIAFLLVTAPDVAKKKKDVLRGLLVKHPAIKAFGPEVRLESAISNVDSLIWGNDGFTLIEAGMMQWAKANVATFLLTESFAPYRICSERQKKNMSQMFCLFSEVKADASEQIRINSIWSWIEALLGRFKKSKMPENHWLGFTRQSYFFSIERFKPEAEAVLIHRSSIYNAHLKDLYCTEITKDTLVYSTDSAPESWINTNYLMTVSKMPLESPIGFWKINPNAMAPFPLSPLAQTWKDIIGQPLIPFNLDTRKSQLAHVYEELAPEIACWEKGGTYAAARELERQQRQNNT